MADSSARPFGGLNINFNTVIAGGCVAFAIFLFLIIPTQVEKQPTLFGVTGSGLDPAFFPNLVAFLLLLIGGAYLWLSRGMHEPNGFRGMTGNNYWNIGVTLAVLLLYAATMQPLGFLAASALVITILCVFYGARHIPSILLVAIGVPVAIYFVFGRLLHVALPEFPDF